MGVKNWEVEFEKKFVCNFEGQPDREAIDLWGKEKVDELKQFIRDLLPKPKTTKLITTDPIDRELSLLLVKEIEIQLPTFKTPNMDVWATHINKMRRLDNRTPQQIEFIIKWCQSDGFWQGNILSTKKLREKFDTLTAQAKRNQVNVVDISNLK